jgi:hypothetical protein
VNFGGGFVGRSKVAFGVGGKAVKSDSGKWMQLVMHMRESAMGIQVSFSLNPILSLER